MYVVTARRQGAAVVTDEVAEGDTVIKSEVAAPLPPPPIKARCIGLFTRKNSTPAALDEDAVHDAYVPPSPSGRVRSWMSNKLNAAKGGKGARCSG